MTQRRDIGGSFRFACAVVAWVALAAFAAAEEVRVATFNVMNYLCMDRRIEGRYAPGYPKPEAEKAAVRAVLLSVRADVVCLQEIGSQPFLDELQQDLEREGLSYPHAALLEASDPLRHVAVLSRLPFGEVVRHADVTFPHLGREERVKRGMLEVQFASAAGTWRLFVVHLKSPLTQEAEDPGAEKRRTAEARALRDLVLKRAAGERESYLIAGDLNAASDSRALAGFTKRGERQVALALRAADSRGETWTHRQLVSDRYERLDYILASPAMVARVKDGRAMIHDGPDALGGTDHRLVWVDLDLSGPAEAQAAETETPAGIEPAGVSDEKG